jgi:hypothetical protein
VHDPKTGKSVPNVPNGHKISQMAVKYINIYQSTSGPPKFTHIGIFGLKINHLATLPQSNNEIGA